MRITPLVQWHEGMFLAPQHFQIFQRRTDDLHQFHHQLYHPHSFGVITLAWDGLALNDKILRIQTLNVIMPDGTWGEVYEHEDHPDLSLNLDPYKDTAESEPLRVYLCLAQASEHDAPTHGAHPRYDSIELHNVRDAHAMDQSIAIPTLKPHLKLIASSTHPAHYASFPIAELMYDGREFQHTDFIPPTPCLDIKHSLHKRAQHLMQRARSKLTYLRDKCEQSFGTTFFHETGEQIKPLLRILPVLESTIAGQSIPPYHLYQLLCWTLGELSSMRLNITPSPVPLYTHDQCTDVIERVFHMCDTILDSIEQSIITLHFQQKDRLFFLKLAGSLLEKDMYIGVKVPSSMAIEDTFLWMRDAVIASDSVIEDVRSKRMKGAVRTPLTADEVAQLGVARGMMIFKLPPSEFIKGDENLNLFNGSDHTHTRPHHLVLYVKDVPEHVFNAA